MEFELTGNETPAELEALLDKLGNEEVDVVDDDAVPPAAASTTTPPATTPPADAAKPTDQSVAQPGKEGVTTAATPAAQGDKPTDTPKGILSKDGKHVIPYDVLEAARAEARRNAESGQQTAAQLAEAQRQLEVLTRQLTTLGTTPAALPEKTKITPEQINGIRDGFPELAVILDAMVQKIDYLQQSAPEKAVATSGDPVLDAVNAVPDLKSWKDSDLDRFQLAVHLDSKLENDPAWKGKPLQDRFAEVAKRVKLAYGDEVAPAAESTAVATLATTTMAAQPSTEELQKLAAEKLAAATAAAKVPASPSELGQANTTSSESTMDWASTASDGELMKKFSTMTEAQIEAILSQAI